MIRQFREEDIIQLKQIHEKFYKEEFEFQDFCSQFIDFFIIEEYGRIISAGGIRSIAESVIMTDKEMLSKTKVRALHQMLEAQMFTCGRLGYHQLHAFIQEKDWERHLIKIGFKQCKGDALFIGV
jgi:N-acetylglutamate synthase-like GNAT family acetyltransferase